MTFEDDISKKIGKINSILAKWKFNDEYYTKLSSDIDLHIIMISTILSQFLKTTLVKKIWQNQTPNSKSIV